MRLRITLISVIIVIISAFGFTSFASAVPVAEPVAKAAAKDPKPTSRCPEYGAVFKWGAITNINARMRKKFWNGEGGIWVRMTWRPRSGFRICRIRVTNGSGKAISKKKFKSPKPLGDSYEWFNKTGQGSRVDQIWIFVKKK